MEPAYIINLIGLCLDIAGVLLVFIYGIPQGSLMNKEGVQLQAWSTPNEEMKRDWKKYNFWSKLGLTLICFGFLLQALSTILQGKK